jgi:hypothetical protein
LRIGEHDDPKPIADQLINDGVTIITIAYVQSDEAPLPAGIDSIASIGYNLSNIDRDLNTELLNAFCNSNHAFIIRHLR